MTQRLAIVSVRSICAPENACVSNAAIRRARRATTTIRWARARAFVAAGATALHGVDLDGAFGSGEERCRAARHLRRGRRAGTNRRRPCARQADVQARIDAGAAAVVLGTILIEEPDTARAIVAAFGERIVAGIDARGDRVATRGWQKDAGILRDDLVRDVATWGVRRVVYTEIARDGMGSGYDVAALAHVAGLAPVSITASGGAKTLADLLAAARRYPGQRRRRDHRPRALRRHARFA